MQTEWTFTIADRLAVVPEVVWRSIGTMHGVNEELRPLLRMTYPSAFGHGDLTQAPTGAYLFHSWLLLGGFLPIDRHHLRLTRVDPGRGFVEDSVSWANRSWRHERFVEAAPGGCKLTDRLIFRPRFFLAGPVINWFVRRLFIHRHRQLRHKFGG